MRSGQTGRPCHAQLIVPTHEGVEVFEFPNSLLTPRVPYPEAGEARATRERASPRQSPERPDSAAAGGSGTTLDSLLTVSVCPPCFDCAVPAVQ